MLKKSTLYFLLFLFILWIIFAAWLCKDRLCGLGGDTNNAIGVVDKVKEKATLGLGAWNVRDGSAFTNTCDQHFGYNRSNSNFITPLLGNSKTCVTQTVDYLKSHKDRSLMITGYYSDQESNAGQGILDNLGLNRANKVKNYLAGLGVAKSQMDITSKLSQKDWWKGDMLSKGIDFSFGAASNSNTRIDDIKSRLLGKPLTLYFGTNQDDVNLTSQQRSDMADIMYYLDNVSSSTLDIDGHTDNVGNEAYNVNLSQERADFVREYLQANGGISAAKMNTKGQGPHNPIAENSTDEGKAKNRRVEVILR